MIRLLPTSPKFFELFERQSATVLAGARALKDLAENFTHVEQKAVRIKELETEGDHVTHDLIDSLNRTFITPFDREDLYALASSLDNVMDAIDHVAALVRLYKLTKMRPGTRELIRTVSGSADRIHSALEALAAQRPVHPHAVEINRLENEADRAYQEAIRLLFDDEADPIMVIKWKEFFDMLERITDCCEDVANVIEGVVVKHG